MCAYDMLGASYTTAVGELYYINNSGVSFGMAAFIATRLNICLCMYWMAKNTVCFSNLLLCMG